MTECWRAELRPFNVRVMLVNPSEVLTDFYATACDWVPAGHGPPAGLTWFVVVSFFNGVGLEIGRKIRAPENEEEGVRTYSHLWGGRVATLAWGAALVVTATGAIAAATQIGFEAGPPRSISTRPPPGMRSLRSWAG